MAWWQILLDVLPVVVTGIFSFWLYKLKKRDNEISYKLEQQEKAIERYYGELKEYRQNKQFYQNWLFEKKFSIMDELSISLYDNIQNAFLYYKNYGRSAIDFATIDKTELTVNYKKCIADFDNYTKLAYSAQFYIEDDIAVYCSEFYKEMQKIIQNYTDIIENFNDYIIPPETETANHELIKKITNKSDAIINYFKSIVKFKVTDFSQ